MNDPDKRLRDLASGAVAALRSTGAYERALEAQASIEKLTKLNVLGGDRLSRLALGLPSAEMKTAMEIASGKLGAFDLSLSHASAFGAAQRSALELNDQFEKYSAVRSAIGAAAGDLNRFKTSAYGRAYDMATRLSDPDGRRFGNLVDERVAKSIGLRLDPYSAALASQPDIFAIGRDASAALGRTQAWAKALLASPTRDFAAFLGAGDRFGSEFEAVRVAAGSIAAATAGLDKSGIAAAAAAMGGNLTGLSTTATKMSLFSASLDVLGPGAGGCHAAYKALLGDYETSAVPVRPYWRDPRERARYYRDQEVDEDLIDADNAMTVAALIDSGVVEGQLTRSGTMTAVVEAGPVSVRIMASRPKMGAFGAIDHFENELRAFVAKKLAAACGPSWFKQRVPGDISGRAKDRRREAMRAGEAYRDLIHFTDLGDLIGVITRKDNWHELFEAVFDRAEWLKVDLERLNANRRPTMHSRPVDPVQLCEIVFTIRRLVEWMQRDGAWDQGWDSDI